MRTVRDLDNAFRLYLDRVDAQSAPSFEPEEREQILNDAQLWVARGITSKKTPDQDDVDLRRTLSTELNIPVTNRGVASLPEDFLNHGRITCKLKGEYSGCEVAPSVVSENDLSQVLYTDPFNAPTLDNISVCYLNGSVLVFPPDVVNSLGGSYYRKPAQLLFSTPTQVPDMAEALFPTIVQRAVQLALESTQDVRTPTQAQIATLTQTP